MRRRARLGSWTVVLLLPFFASVAVANDAEIDDGIDLYFRDVDLSAVSDQALETYPSVEPGESQLLDRSFPGAPPQISHTVADTSRITFDDNECIDCHHPDNVAGKEDAPLPKSHFSRPVMGAGGKGSPMVWAVKSYEDTKDVPGTRYNCTMCHVPQATNVDTPASSFTRLEPKSSK